MLSAPPKILLKVLALSVTFFVATSSVKGQQHSRYKAVLVGGVPVMIDSLAESADHSAVSVQPVSTGVTQRTQNLCGVTASFTPGTDSFLTSISYITFTSTSINATSWQWQVNGYNYSQSQTLGLLINMAGTYEITLTATNGTCTDVHTVTFVYIGTPPPDGRFFSGSIGFNNNNWEKGFAISNTADNGFVIGGNTTYNNRQYFPFNALIVKLRSAGCLEWTKQITSSTTTTDMVNQVYGLRDSGLLVSGNVGQENYLMRMDKAGNSVWANQYSLAVYSGYKQLYEMSDGSIIGATSPFGDYFSVGKMDANGQPVWTKYLRKDFNGSSFISTTAFIEWKSALYLLGTLKLPDPDINTSAPFVTFLIKMNPGNGDVIWTEMFMTENFTRSITSKDIQVHGDRLLLSSLNYSTLGGFTVNPVLHWIDSSGAVIAAKSLTQNVLLDFPTGVKAGVLPSGNIMLYFRGKENIGGLPSYFLWAYYMKLGSDTNIVVTRQAGGGSAVTSEEDIYTAMNFNGRAISNTGTGYGALLPWLSNSQNIYFQSRDSSFTDWGCSYDNNAYSVSNMVVQPVFFTWAKDSLMNTTVTPVALDVTEVYPQIKSSCPDYIDSCAVLKVRGPNDVCNLNNVYTYKAGKNNKCPQSIEWSYEGPLTVINQTDSTISVQYNSYGSYKIVARLHNICNPVLDSMSVTVTPPPAQLNLGSDLVLCENNTVILHASPRFLTYTWQDGSSDSLFTANNPGLYWVEVTDGCGNVMRDTVYIAPAPPVSLNAGPDRIKCNNDTLHLNGPQGFITYQWSNDYNITYSSGPLIIVNPLIDTAYYLKAELTPGCFGFDTIRIKVYQSPPIQLGNDTSFCRGDSVRFDAGASFSQYVWNNNASSSTIIVKDPGTYSVIGTTAQGCTSYDTVRVINVWPLPLVNIKGKPVICLGTPVLLDAGISLNNGTYLWNNGSSTQTISVTNPGIYSVIVEDYNGCTGTDAFEVARISALPANFLFGDTAICSYETITLKPSGVYTSYLWSTTATTSSISVRTPGQYWLLVKDRNDCEGTDTVQVNAKDCMTGVYFPTAFTPNGDGKNEILKPAIFGLVKNYLYTVYNRWGEIVFRSDDPSRGWDGRNSGRPQDSNVFVWTCTYQLEGGKTEHTSGTAMLIR